MQTQSLKKEVTVFKDSAETVNNFSVDHFLSTFPGKENVKLFENPGESEKFLPQNKQLNFYKLLMRLSGSLGKKNFLVFKHNKYINVPTETIAYFYVKYDTTIIVCFDKKEYAINYSLEYIQELLTEHQFFRLNRQVLINFYAVKEVEHYFSRKLLVTLTVPVQDKLLVSKEKAGSFLYWLENK